MSTEPVSIIIPNFNGESLLAANLPGVIAAGRAYAGKVEIIVVDDASADRSVSMLTGGFPQARLVCHAANRGFADAVHSGVAAAAYEVLIFLNSDVRPAADFIAPLVETLMGGNDLFAVSPLVYDPQGRLQNVAWNRYKMVRGTIKSTPWDLTTIDDCRRSGRALKSLFASGGSIALKKEKFNRLGGFLPLYKPFYMEDMDLCTRAWMHGWPTLLDPRSTVVHDHVGTIKRFFRAQKIRSVRSRNRLLYLWLYCSRRRLILSHVPWTAWRLLLRLLRLDLTFPIALFQSLARLRAVMVLRAQMKQSQGFLSLDRILKEIDS
ncbi:MAG: glycosyltransferase family 2 protein [Desulfobacterales bacterium]